MPVKRNLAAFALAALMLAAASYSLAAATPTDIKGTWCEERIAMWVALGIMDGYPDGTFRPDGQITRAEFIRITNRAFNLTGGGGMPFTDVKTSDWFYNDVRTALYFGYINGYPDGTFRPDGNITRQEAAKVICTLINLTQNASAASALADNTTSIDDWARGYVGAVYSNRIMGAYSGGLFKGRQNLTRAECVDSLWNAQEKAGIQIKAQDLTVKKPEYIPDTATQTVNDLRIDYSGDVSVSNLNVLGDVFISSSVANRTVTLKNVNIDGTVYMDFGNLVFDGSNADDLDCTNSVTGRTVTLKGVSTIANAYTGRSVIIDQAGVTGAGQGIENLVVGDERSAEVVLKGTFPRIYVQQENQSIVLASGTIKELESPCRFTTVTLGQGTKLEYGYLSAGSSSIVGPGDVAHAYVNSTGVSLQRAPAKLSGPYNPTTSGDYKLTITVKDSSSGRAISGAEITLDTYVASGKTSGTGVLEFSRVTSKVVYYTVTASGYGEMTGAVSMSGTNRYVDVELNPVGEWTAELTVVDAATNKPITGIYGYLTSLGDKRSTLSDAAGKIYFNNLGSTTYTYSIGAPGYVTATGTFTVSNRDLVVTAAVKLQKTKVNLTVYSEAVQTTQIKTYEYYIPGVTSGYVKADSAGRATIEGLDANSSYTVQIRALNAQGAPDSNYLDGSVIVRANDSKTTAEFKGYLISSASYTYSVTVLSWDGSQTVNGATVTLSNSLWSGSATTVNGIAQITGVPKSNNYTLTVTNAGYITATETGIAVDAGKLSNSVNLVGVRNVTVNVRQSGAALPSMALTLESADGVKYSATTNSAGTAAFSSVPDGQYTVSSAHADYMIDRAQRTVTVEQGSVTFDLDAVLLELDFTLRFLEDGSLVTGINQVTLTIGGTSQDYTVTNGVSELITLKKGSYTVTVAGYTAAPATLVIGGTAEGTQMEITLTPNQAP